MLFNSLDFAVFLPIVFMVYWFLLRNRLNYQNIFLVGASYLFYGWWDWRFLFLILISTLIDFQVGKRLESTDDPKSRKVWVLVSILTNLGILGFFKYFNFFIESFAAGFSLLGMSFSAERLSIILPVGISFYTFQTMSYSLDVYRKRMRASHRLVEFMAFVSFFPQLVAGPIERASNLLPQFAVPRTFDPQRAIDGLRQILWGFFKKVVIADNAAIFVNDIFADPTVQSGSTLMLALFFFAFQIYGDFSGYSDIAIGTAKLLGFQLMQNFAFPYFSRDIAEFWRRWHISLSTWFRDYVYIPLGGSQVSKLKIVRNTLIIFLISGFWHGANFTFLAWGLINALYFLPLILSRANRRHLAIIGSNGQKTSLREWLGMLTTFLLVLLAWTFFRASSISEAFSILNNIFSTSIFQPIAIWHKSGLQTTFWLIILFIGIEWIGRKEAYALSVSRRINSRKVRWFSYSLVLFLIGMFMQTNESPFIYFQF